MTGEIIKRYADIAREHLSRDYGLVYLDCNHMLAIEATLATMQRERDEAREMLAEAVEMLSQISKSDWASIEEMKNIGIELGPESTAFAREIDAFLSRCEGVEGSTQTSQEIAK